MNDELTRLRAIEQAAIELVRLLEERQYLTECPTTRALRKLLKPS